jgi:hypothetical protein
VPSRKANAVPAPVGMRRGCERRKGPSSASDPRHDRGAGLLTSDAGTAGGAGSSAAVLPVNAGLDWERRPTLLHVGACHLHALYAGASRDTSHRWGMPEEGLQAAHTRQALR